MTYALDGLAKLRHSVMQKKIELEKEKLEMKLSFVLHSQVSVVVYDSIKIELIEMGSN